MEKTNLQETEYHHDKKLKIRILTSSYIGYCILRANVFEA